MWSATRCRSNDRPKQSEEHQQASTQFEEQFRQQSVEHQQAAEDRERKSVAERDVERRRVGQALDRARTQLLEWDALRSQRAGRAPVLVGAA